MDESFDPLLLKNQLCFPLYAAAKEVIRRYEPFLKPLDLTYTQYIVMLALWEKRECSVSGLGEMVYLDSGTLSPLLDKLVRKGLLEKRKGEDGRSRIVALTPKGEAMKNEAKDIPMKIGSCLKLSPEEAKTVYTVCHRLMEKGE